MRGGVAAGVPAAGGPSRSGGHRSPDTATWFSLAVFAAWPTNLSSAGKTPRAAGGAPA
jgi:hypothetical protein